MRSIIVGTAGHIDHGKSALVRALTGTDPDRLPEEKRRGITIDLGFAELDLGELHIGFVDVPGHERFVKNMLAGAHGIDLVALVVAADEGVMPQTREHFDICRLLGVQKGLVVITKTDLVDEEMLLLVEEELKELLAGSFLDDMPIVSVSARTGAGLDQLKNRLEEIGSTVAARSADSIMRLPIDRTFSMKGFGAVVTGTLVSGEITEADDLELQPLQHRVRVRGVQVHGHAVPVATSGQRTAVNLGGVDSDQIQRGMVLAPLGRLRSTQIIDAWIDVLPNTSRPIRSRARLRVHIGASEVLARVRVLTSSGEIQSGKGEFAQIRLESPVIALHGDHFIVRSYSPATTIAGGIVVDPFALKHRGRELERTRERLKSLLNPDRISKFVAFVNTTTGRGTRMSEIAASTGWTSELLLQTAADAQSQGLIVDTGGVYLSAESFARFSRAVTDELRSHHKREPLAKGMLRETLREKVFAHSEPEVFSSVISKLEKDEAIVADKETIRIRAHNIDLSETDIKLRASILESYQQAALEAPSIDEVMTRAGVVASQRAHARKILQLLIDSRQVVRLQGEMFAAAKAIDELVSSLKKFGADHEPERMIDVATFKELAGVSRKYAIPLLEYLDRERITRRAGDKRYIV